jgi:hypothetical protein
MKYTIFFIFLFNVFIKSSGQKDSILVINCFKYLVINGKTSDQRTIYNQKTFDKQGRLIREIFYLDSIVQIKSIIFFFYNNDKLISKEEYNGDNSIKNINRLYYNTKGYLSEEIIYESFDKLLQKKYRVLYTYKDSILIQKIVYDSTNNWLEKTNWNNLGLKNTEITNYKEGSNKDHLKKRLTSYIIRNFNQEMDETKLFFFGRKYGNQTIDYTYNTETDKLEKETLRDSDNSIVSIKVYEYNKDGSLNCEAVKDKENNYLEYYKIERHNYFAEPGKKEMYPIQ